MAHYEKVPTSLPNLKSVIDHPDVQAPDSFFGETLMPAIETSLKDFKIFPSTPASDKEQQIMNAALIKYLTEDVSLDDVLKDAEDELNTQIGNPFELFD